MKHCKSGMTLVEVVISMAILALTVAISFAAISFSINLLDRAETVGSEYVSAIEDIADKLDNSPANDKSVILTVDGSNVGNITFNKVKTQTDSESNILGSFYFYALK